MKPNWILYAKAGLHVIIGALAPVLTLLVATGAITGRAILAALVGAIIGGAVPLLAFLNTSFADSPMSKMQT